ncbi:MAG TPA: TolC family protein, partial [Spirochaetota bacterium]|nr:TolC family protein [Spirochaetota bacterium]
LNYYNALVANAEASMEMSNQTYKESVRTLLAALNQNVDEAKIGNVVLCENPPSFKEEDYLSLALAQRYDYLAAKLGVENAKLQMGIYENSEAPSLKAGVTVKTTAMDEFSPAYSDTFSAKYPTLEAGLAMSYPLGDTEQKTNMRDSKYKYEQAKIALQKNEKDVRNDVKNKIENVSAAYNVMKSMERARIQSEEYYRLLLANLRRGRFSAITVKTALDARTDSRQAALRAKVNYNIALIQLEIASNNLLKKFGVKVKADDI